MVNKKQKTNTKDLLIRHLLKVKILSN